jgi:hypothetical protein
MALKENGEKIKRIQCCDLTIIIWKKMFAAVNNKDELSHCHTIFSDQQSYKNGDIQCR